MNETTYNGWRNRETWNVALYIQNEYELYTLAKHCKNYSQFLMHSWRVRNAYTPDGVRWTSRKISRSEINAMLRELN